ncbi:DUF305 domain-containing protein [Plantactinospora sp. S1510]|uniref:DUF305 domain-containing protein n=1 Tax=Plantactinospora alkalitolerans TaxID=2789879 RepID=A0ABS0H9E6_9ACTN|nr:DUF305 domain-containing protein [Plantactinospora alkalitolerans]MBF9134798.1 DUF305 domain-containing protein [Plantactinospora alkalitolerans]
MSPRTVVPPTALLVVALLVAACAGSATPPATSDPGTPTSAGPTSAGPTSAGPTSAGPTTAGPAAPAGTTSSSAPYNGTDIAWLQLTVAMHERVLPMLALVPAQTTDPALRRLAAQVEDTHRAELAQSRKLLDRSGAPRTNPHEGHDMPGMVTAAELAALGTATEAQFRRLFSRHLREHLGQAARVARAEQKSGADPATTALAATVARTASAALTQLDHL